MHSKKLFITLGVIVVVGAGAVGAGSYFRSRGYEVISPKIGPVTEAIYGLGKVKTDRRFEIKLGVTSEIAQIFVREGDIVKKGQPLLRTDPTLFRAPFDGTVTRLNANVGEVAPPQIVLLRLEDLSDRYIELTLEQESALRVRKNQTALVSFETLRDQRLSGKVTSIFTRDNEFVARIELQGLSASVLPGMTADVSVEVGRIAEALLIPLRAISGGMVILEKTNGKREKLKVEIGHVDRDWAEVKGSNIAPGDRILVPNGGK